jgi:LDH2 family malate/lactate/ureidoglycolate dehydrogenase
MRRALLRRGVSRQQADDVVDGLIEASLRGVDTHGVRLLPTYLRELDGGRCRARPELRFTERAPSARVLDAGHALGPVAGRAAARQAVRLAKRHGVGAVAVRNSNYFGASAQYTLAMARHDVIGISFTNSDALVAPVGGNRPLFGTNPLSFAVRGAGEDVFCVDMATSQTSFTEIKQRRARGIPLAPGWAVGPDGRDASQGDGGEIAALLPLGGHKGQCLAMMVEILCCLLAGMPFDHQLSHLYDEPFDRPRLTSHFFLALDVEAFHQQPLDAFRARLSELLELVRGQGDATGARTLAPGDVERETFAERSRRGIPLTDSELAELRRIDGEEEPGAREDL